MYYWIFGLLGLAALGLDQWVKAWTTAHLALGETTPLLPGLVELMRVHNYGAAWSSFSGQKWLLLGVTGVIVLAVAWLLVRKVVRHPVGILACCLILSGGIGNIIDRLSSMSADLNALKEKPSKRWETVVAAIITGAIGYLLASIGIRIG